MGLAPVNIILKFANNENNRLFVACLTMYLFVECFVKQGPFPLGKLWEKMTKTEFVKLLTF